MPIRQIPNWLIGSILVVASIGFLDAAYLTAKRFTGSALNCYFFGGCDAVNASPYSVVFGIPLSLYGSVFYLLVILSTVAYLLYHSSRAWQALVILTSAGFLFSLYSTFLQALVIKAWCFYCVVSAATSTANFILMLVGWKKYSSKTESANESVPARPA